MALLKNTPFKGYSATYWRIQNVNINLERTGTPSSAIVTLALYKDKASRDSDVNSHLMFINVSLFDDIKNSVEDTILVACYEAVKKLSSTRKELRLLENAQNA